MTEAVMAEIPATGETINSIQILRAIAAVMVAYVHSTNRGGVESLPRFGAFGVDIFFVISGFVIASISSKNTKHFFIKRIFRIAPLYIIATSVTALACVSFPEKVNTMTVNAAAFIKSILFIPYLIDTKFESSGPIVQQGWSLNQEMFFYLIMAVCVMVVKNKRYLGITCALILAGIFMVLNCIDTNIFLLNYYQHSLFPEFIYGIILFYIYTFLKEKNVDRLLIKSGIINTAVFGSIGFACLMYLILDSVYGWHITGERNIYYGVPSLVIVFAFLNIERLLKHNGAVNLFVKLGDASYSLYLFHILIITFLTRLLFKNIIANGNLIISVLLDLIILTICIAGSVIIHNAVDKPIQKLLRNILNRNVY
jgi:exopolysaccharide production protein ExoZ